MKDYPRISSAAPIGVTCLYLAVVFGAIALHKKLPELASGPEPEPMTVRTTAYTHSEAGHLVYGRQTASGTTLQSGKVNSAAADWSVFPVGTKFKIVGEDTVYEVEDYGSALVGTETIDIYRPSRSSMNQWGVRHVDIESSAPAGCSMKASHSSAPNRPRSVEGAAIVSARTLSSYSRAQAS